MATGGRGRRGGRGPRCSSARDNARAAATATRTPTWCRTSLRAASRPPHVPHYSSALSTERGVVRRPPALALPAPQNHAETFPSLATLWLTRPPARRSRSSWGAAKGGASTRGPTTRPGPARRTRACLMTFSASAAGRRAPRTPLARASARCSALHGPGAEYLLDAPAQQQQAAARAGSSRVGCRVCGVRLFRPRHVQECDEIG